MCDMCAWQLQSSEDGIGSPGTGVRDGWDWESKLSTLQKQPVL